MPIDTDIWPVRVDEVGKDYPGDGVNVVALQRVSLRLSRGEMVALMGPSGCGKSTLLHLIGCVDKPTSGSVSIEGCSTSTLDDAALTALRRERIGTVFQAFYLLPGLTIAENVGLPLTLLGESRAEIARKVADILERIGLLERMHARPNELSGGQQQRVAVARAVIHRPAIVLADEPTGNLDSVNGRHILQLLRSLVDMGQTLLIATHSEEAAAYCHRKILLHDGRLMTDA